MSQVAQQALERRHSVRQKSLFRGIVYFESNPYAVECLVRDISEAGARVKFAEPPAGTARHLELQIPIKAQRHHCRVVWRVDDELGVAFAEAAAAAQSQEALVERMARLEAEIEHLKRIVRALQSDGNAAGAA